MVLLSDERPFDAEAFRQQFQRDWPEAGAVGQASVSECVTSVDVGDTAIMVAEMPVPIPQFAASDQRVYMLWPDAKTEVPRHRRHWIVTLTGPDNSVLDRTRMLTKAVHSLLATHPSALGITWGSQANLVSSARFQQVAPGIRDGEDPVLLWVDVQCGWRPEGAAAGRSAGLTRGMCDFDKMDFEALDAYETPLDLYMRLNGLIEYVLINGAVIRDGDTIGQDANEKIRVVYSPSSFGLDERVMRLEYAPPNTRPGGLGAYAPSPFSPGSNVPAPGAPANPWGAVVSSDHPAATVTWTPTTDPYPSASLSPLAGFSLLLAGLAPFLMCFCFLHVPVLIASALMGHVAVHQIGRSNGRQYGSGIAILALVIDYALLAGTLVFCVYFFVYLPNTRPTNPPASSYPSSPVESGEGLDIPLDESLPSLDPALDPATGGPATSPTPTKPGDDSTQPFVPPPPPIVIPPVPPGTPPTGPPTPSPNTEPPAGTPRPDQPTSSSPPKKTRPAKKPPESKPAAEADPANVKLKVPDVGWSVMSLAFSRDGRRLAIGKLDSSLIVYDVESGERLLARDHVTKLGQVSALGFAPSGDVVYAGGWSGAIMSFSTTDADAEPTLLAPHTRNVGCLEVSPDGRFVISGADDGTVTWQVPGEPSKVRTIKAVDRKVLAVRLGTPPLTAWATDGRSVAVINLREAKVTQTETLTKNYVHAAAFSADGQQISASTGSEVSVWNMGKADPTAKFKTGSEMQWSVQFTPDQRFLLCGGQGKVTAWDVAGPTQVAEFKLASPLYVKSLAISPDSRFFAAIPEAAGQTLYVFQLP